MSFQLCCVTLSKLTFMSLSLVFCTVELTMSSFKKAYRYEWVFIFFPISIPLWKILQTRDQTKSYHLNIVPD